MNYTLSHYLYHMDNIENDVNTYNSLAVLIITLFIVFYKYKTSSVIDIIIYLFIVYDLDHLIDHIFELYKILKYLL